MVTGIEEAAGARRLAGVRRVVVERRVVRVDAAVDRLAVDVRGSLVVVRLVAARFVLAARFLVVAARRVVAARLDPGPVRAICRACLAKPSMRLSTLLTSARVLAFFTCV